MNRRTRRLLTATAFTLGAITLVASAWTAWTPGFITATVLLTTATAAQTIENRRDPAGPQIPLDTPDHHHDGN